MAQVRAYHWLIGSEGSVARSSGVGGKDSIGLSRLYWFEIWLSWIGKAADVIETGFGRYLVNALHVESVSHGLNGAILFCMLALGRRNE